MIPRVKTFEQLQSVNMVACGKKTSCLGGGDASPLVHECRAPTLERPASLFMLRVELECPVDQNECLLVRSRLGGLLQLGSHGLLPFALQPLRELTLSDLFPYGTIHRSCALACRVERKRVANAGSSPVKSVADNAAEASASTPALVARLPGASFPARRRSARRLHDSAGQTL